LGGVNGVQRFWDNTISPLLDALRPRVIVEVGAESGAVTVMLLAWAATREAVVHSVDPLPAFEPDQFDSELIERLRFHRARSLQVLESIGAVDLALIDGDHNWYTVVNELRTLERSALIAGQQLPVILLHDVGWPYSRRDLYYEPISIPHEHRHRYARRGIIPDQSELGEPGLNAHLRNAMFEGGPANGVLTAVEDFVAESSSEWTFHEIPGFSGLGILNPTGLTDEHGRIRDLLDDIQTGEFLRRQCDTIERARITAEIARARASRELRQARASIVTALEDDDPQQPAELGSLRRVLARTQLRLQEAEAERIELEGELERAAQQGRAARRREREHRAEREEYAAELENRAAELARVEARLQAGDRRLEQLTGGLSGLEAAHEALGTEHDTLISDHRRLQAQLRGAEAEAQQLTTDRETAQARERALGSELDRIRRELEAAQAEIAAASHGAGDLARELESAQEALIRSEADANALRNQLQAKADDWRAELGRTQRSEAKTQQELTQLASELELAAAQGDRLQRALARARVDSDVANAERDAFERRASELNALLERAANGFADRVADPESGPPQFAEPAPLDARAFAAQPEGDGDGDSAAAWRQPTAREDDYVAEWPLLPASEFQAQAGFAAAHPAAVAVDPDGNWLPDVAGSASPVDRRGVLAARGELQESDQPTVDVLICVHDALDDLRSCLWSLMSKTDRRFRLILVNDGSGPVTSQFLSDVAADQPAVTLVHRDQPPHGYTLAANAGLGVTESDYVVLLNSDTILTYGWLERIVAYGERHERLGVLGPLSNAAGHQSVPHRREAGEWATNPLPDWITEDGVAFLIRQLSSDAQARLPFINGFCYVIKRAVIDAIGVFDDELFPTGYCEENDYSQRARDAGFELGVVDDAYVFHAKSRSYGSARSLELRRHNYGLFLDKHGRETINELVRSMEGDSALASLREAVANALSDPDLAAAALGGDRLSIVFVLPGLAEGGSGGSHSIYQEVHGMRRLGIPARIALRDTAWERASNVYADAPEVIDTFADLDELARITANADVIVATHFKSVDMVCALQRQRQDFLAGYYIQDYEPFFSPSDRADHAEAKGSYTALTDGLSFAKTHWLCNVIGERHGTFVAKVEPSIDEQVFHALERTAGDGPLRVVAMVRPRTPRRQPYSTVTILERLIAQFGDDVAITTFGCHQAQLETLTDSSRVLERHAGLLGRAQVAALFRQADVFLDVSMYQAFGRTALEAMACGCTAVVPRVGGACEFAIDDDNALVVDTLDRTAPFSALASLVFDRERLYRLQTGAVRTAARYSVVRAALSEYVAMSQAHRARLRGR
jgi:GT2 family glycosyltransferase/glycosyltransferase involved in cell wall biosynthesis